MKHLFIFLISTILFNIQLNAYADTDQESVELAYLCDTKNDKLELHYLFYDGNLSEAEILQKSDIDLSKYEVIDSRTALTNTENQEMESRKYINRYCKLKKGTYKVSIEAYLGKNCSDCDYNVIKTFYVKLSEPPGYALKNPKLYGNEDGNIVLDRYTFRRDNTTKTDLITKNIIYESALEKLTITKVSELSMYRPLEGEEK